LKEKIVLVILAAILTFVFGVILWQLQKDRLSLQYEVVESAPFPREGGTGKYFIVIIQNGGSRELRGTEFHVAFESGIIESYRFLDPTLVGPITQTPSELTGTVPLLNPGDSVSATITTFGPTGTRIPIIAARAPGATAHPKPEGSISSLLSWITLGSILTSLTVLILTLLSLSKAREVTDSISRIENLGEVSEQIRESKDDFTAGMDRMKKDFEDRRKKDEEELRGQRRIYDQGGPDREQIIFAVMSRAGLAHRFIDLAFTADETSFWRTGVVLLDGFLRDEQNRGQYVSALEALVGVSEMAPRSRGFNYYLLSKMEKYRGNSEASARWLEKCRTETPLMYEHVMGQDTAFDLEALRLELTQD